MADPEIADLTGAVTSRPEFDAADTFNVCGTAYIGEVLLNGCNRQFKQLYCTESVSGNTKHPGPHHDHLNDVAPFIWQGTRIGDANA